MWGGGGYRRKERELSFLPLRLLLVHATCSSVLNKAFDSFAKGIHGLESLPGALIFSLSDARITEFNISSGCFL